MGQKFVFSFADSTPDDYYICVGAAINVNQESMYYTSTDPLQMLIIANYDTNCVSYPAFVTDGSSVTYNISLKNTTSSNTPTTIQLPDDSSTVTAYILFDNVNSYVTDGNGTCNYYESVWPSPPICIDLVGLQKLYQNNTSSSSGNSNSNSANLNSSKNSSNNTIYIIIGVLVFIIILVIIIVVIIILVKKRKSKSNNDTNQTDANQNDKNQNDGNQNDGNQNNENQTDTNQNNADQDSANENDGNQND